MTNFKKTLGFQIIQACAPVLAGIKPAGMFHVAREKYPFLTRQLRELNKRLNPFGLYFFTICRCPVGELLFIYNKRRLSEILRKQEIRSYLKKKGYPEHVSVEKTIFHFQSNFILKKSFPHEVGILLGYPLEDVIGFENNNGTHFKYAGYWKVYGSVPKACRQFKVYEKCTDVMISRYTAGEKSFEELCHAA
ncbi:MAG: DUF3793 family protein [Treponema sp.]|jgi:hypothetical protein|nr:DUF3793 family protein [Treponema sp.]